MLVLELIYPPLFLNNHRSENAQGLSTVYNFICLIKKKGKLFKV